MASVLQCVFTDTKKLYAVFDPIRRFLVVWIYVRPIHCKSAILIALIFSASAYSQSLAIHNAPQGVKSYANPSQWPAFSGQCHWVPGDGSPAGDPPNTLTHDMAHTHAEFATNGGAPGAPIWAELGNQELTLPITVQLFHTAGKAIIVKGIYLGETGQMDIPVAMDSPVFPLVGDPLGLVKFTGHMTINLATATGNDTDGNPVNVPVHGWTELALFVRTQYDNGDHTDTITVIPLYSNLDPQAPEVPLNEAGIETAIKCGNAMSHDAKEDSVFGLHLVEFRDQTLPILAPITQPALVRVLGYNYGEDLALDAIDAGTYALMLDPDLHMGVAGTQAHTFLGFFGPEETNPGTTFNVDYIDPLQLSTLPQPMNFAPGKHRVSFTWDHVTTPTGFRDQYGNHEPGGLELKALANFIVTIGANPVGCNLTLCPPTPAGAVAPSPVSSPPPGTPPPVTPPPRPPPAPTPSTVWITVGTANRHDVQQLMNDPTTPVVPLQFRVCQAGDANCSSAEIDR